MTGDEFRYGDERPRDLACTLDRCRSLGMIVFEMPVMHALGIAVMPIAELSDDPGPWTYEDRTFDWRAWDAYDHA